MTGPPGEGATDRATDRSEHALAWDGLARYPIRPARLALVRRSFNRLYRVFAADGPAYALRLSPPERIHLPGTEAVEAAWLGALRADGFAVPAVRPGRAGRPTEHIVDRAGVERTVTLFDWLPGKPLREGLTVADSRRLGRVAAALHEHGASWRAPRGLPPAVIADRVLYWTLENRLATHVPGASTLLDEALARAQETLDRLWAAAPHRPHLVHGDLHPGNVLVRRGDMRVLDFQDLFVGLEQQDVAISIGMLHSYPDGKALAEAFRAGYHDVRPFPALDEALLGDLLAARRLHVLNLGLTLRRYGIGSFVDRLVADIRDWMAGPAGR